MISAKPSAIPTMQKVRLISAPSRARQASSRLREFVAAVIIAREAFPARTPTQWRRVLWKCVCRCWETHHRGPASFT
jgi:hypothetical protein